MPKQYQGSEEYPPSEDTFFIADNIGEMRGSLALDIGSGSGYLTRLLAGNFDLVAGTDVNFDVLRRQTYPTPNLVCCNGSDALRAKFDLVVCNLPYLATDEILDVATDGGPGGLEIPKRILDSAVRNIRDGGRLVFVTSSLSSHQELLDYARSLGMEVRIIAKKRLFFEELILAEGTRRLSP